MKRLIKKIIRVTTAMLFALSMCMTCYAAEAFDSNWEVDGAGTWRYKMNDGSYANNAWILDNTQQNWYLLDASGNMRSGIFESYGKYYLLDDVRGTGHFGMLVKNGMSFKGITITASTNADDEGALTQESIEKLKALGYNFGSAASVTGTKHVSGGVVTSEGNGGSSNVNSNTSNHKMDAAEAAGIQKVEGFHNADEGVYNPATYEDMSYLDDVADEFRGRTGVFS